MIEPKKGDIVDFSLENGSIIFASRSGVTVTAGLMDYSTARIVDPQIVSKHQSMFPYFKQKVDNINDPSIYPYMAFKNLNGTIEVIGIPWIKDSTYVTVNTRIATYVISNFKEEFRAPIQTFLSNLGASYTMTVKDQV
ncbi:hypothetical protein [Shewanella phage FishSpeaker]|nr:hypothetical protein [Shewanella phage FishSpeaker]